MNGILLIDKPRDFTSFDVVAKTRGIAKTRKIGHGGTLDPMATGVLPLFFGRAAKAVDLLPDQDKRYTATFRLGTVTDTQDITGEVLGTSTVSTTPEEVAETLRRFTGAQKQIPPMYSAVKIGGKRLYDLARQGVEVDRPPRDITIRSIALLGHSGHDYTIDVACSKGTYIRTLCHDVGAALGCGAVLTDLRRTRACGFSLHRCLTLEEAERLGHRDQLSTALLPVESAFSALPRLNLSGHTVTRFCNGVRLDLEGLPDNLEGRVTVFRGEDGLFLGLADVDRENRVLRLAKLFHIH